MISWSDFVQWSQFFAAILTILAAPSAFGLIRRLFQKRVWVKCWTHSKSNSDLGFEWNIQLTNKTNRIVDHDIYIFPMSESNHVSSIYFPYPQDRSIKYESAVDKGLAHIKIDLWPKGRKVRTRVRLAQPDYIELQSSNEDVRIEFDLTEKPQSNVQLPIIIIARWRALWVASQFSLVALVCVFRVLYLGFRGGPL